MGKPAPNALTNFAKPAPNVLTNFVKKSNEQSKLRPEIKSSTLNPSEIKSSELKKSTTRSTSK